jgi:hypothetical protein
MKNTGFGYDSIRTKSDVVYSDDMRQPFLLAMIVFCVYSCRKTEVQASDTLISHEWTPTRTRMFTIDTTSIVTYDSNGKTHTVSSSFTLDTAYNFETCIQQSTYSFLQNGISQITNACSIGQTITDTPWAIQPGKILQIVFIDDPVADVYLSKLFGVPGGATPSSNGFYPIQNGLLTQVSASEFVVDQRAGEFFSSTYFVNGNKVDSIVKLTVDRYIIFNSR